MKTMIVLAMACVGVVDIHETPVETLQTPVKMTPWGATMQDLAGTFTGLLPWLTNPAEFSDLHNEDMVGHAIEHLVEIAGTMRRGNMHGETVAFPDSDPTLPLVSRLFATNVENAYLMYRYDQKELARLLLRSTVSQCTTCHSRGPDERSSAMFGGTVNVAGMKLNERISLDLAVHRFDDARATVSRTMADETLVRQEPITWMLAAHQGLSIAILVDDDPAHALTVAQRVVRADLPEALRDVGCAWKSAIVAWQNEAAPTSPVDRLALARALIHRDAWTMGNGSASSEADVYNLRAVGVLHTYLRRSTGGPDASEALLLLGQAYEELIGFDLWDLPSLYYEACILNTPHTTIARKCFDRYRDGAFADYGDWAVSTLPLPVAETLFELEELSNPNTAGL